MFGPRCGQRAGRDQDCFGAHARAGRQAHRVRVFEHGAALDEGDLEALERAGVGGFQPRDLAILVGDQRRPVKVRLGNRPAVTGRILEFVGKARGIDQKLLRHAAADDAGAADAIFLGDHHARAVTRRNARGPHAARARADDKQIDVVVRHQPRHRIVRTAGPIAGDRPSKRVTALLQFVAHFCDHFDRKACSPSPAQISGLPRRSSAARLSSFLPTGDL